jgi:hypothetical protein
MHIFGPCGEHVNAALREYLVSKAVTKDGKTHYEYKWKIKPNEALNARGILLLENT